jgi:hypothetical protein
MLAKTIMEELKLLPPPEKKVVAKQLILNGYSSRKVQLILGIDDVTALRYAEQPTPDDLKQFEALFTSYIHEHKQLGIKAVHQRLLELIPKERRIDQVVKAGEFLEGRSQSSNPHVLQQFNVGGKDGNSITFLNFKNESKG